MIHLVETISELRERGVGFQSLSDGVIDTTSPSGELESVEFLTGEAKRFWISMSVCDG